MQNNVFHKKVSMSHVPVYLELIVGISFYPFHITVFPMRFSDTNPNDAPPGIQSVQSDRMLYVGQVYLSY